MVLQFALAPRGGAEEVGEIYLKEGVEPGKIAYKNAEETGMSHNMIKNVGKVKYEP